MVRNVSLGGCVNIILCWIESISATPVSQGLTRPSLAVSFTRRVFHSKDFAKPVALLHFVLCTCSCTLCVIYLCVILYIPYACNYIVITMGGQHR